MKTNKLLKVESVRVILAILLCLYCCQNETRATESQNSTPAQQGDTVKQLPTPTIAEQQQPETLPTEQGVQKKQESSEGNTAKPLTRAEGYTILLGVLGLVLICVQAAISYWQWKAMRDGLRETRRSIEIAQDSMVYAQRAYITITKGEIVGTPNDPLFQLKIENSGNTPAYDIQVARMVEVKDSAPAIEANWTTWSKCGLIAPKGFVHLLVPTTDAMTEEQGRLLEAGNLQLYCWGEVRYRDIFGKTRFTKFCFSGRPVVGHFGPCTSGNEAD